MCVDTLGFLIQPKLRGLGRYSKLTLLVLTHGRKRKRAGYGCRNSNDSRLGASTTRAASPLGIKASSSAPGPEPGGVPDIAAIALLTPSSMALLAEFEGLVLKSNPGLPAVSPTPSR